MQSKSFIDFRLVGGTALSLYKGHRMSVELLKDYSLQEMLLLHKRRAEFTHDEAEIRKNLLDFTKADEEYDPICLRGKYWEFIKEDFEELIAKGE